MSTERGFSLLELLVVLFIAGLMTSLGVAWLDSGKAGTQQALERLAAVSRQQADQAVHAGQLRGLRWTGTRPEFVRMVNEHWQLEKVALGDWPGSLRADWVPSQTPQLIFTPSGVAQPRALRWHWPEGAEQWRWDASGRLLTTRTP